jgi:TPR repeat protein
MHQLGGIVSDTREALRWEQGAASTGSSAAMVALGRLAEEEGKVEKAKDWYHRAADSGADVGMHEFRRLERGGGPDSARPAVVDR